MTTSLKQQTPLTIITGFLGSGKTTLLNRILHADHGLRIAVLVNDFGSINIDSQLVLGVDEDTISLSNGCICCTIRGDLLKATVDLLNREEAPEYIIVETSGVSDPLEVALTFRTMPQIRIDSILTVIDAEQILSVDRQYAVLAMNQVGMADIVILNKTDLVTSTTLQAVRNYIRSILPHSRILETQQAQVALDLILNVGNFDLERLQSRTPASAHVHETGEHHDHEHQSHDLVFSTWSWKSDEPISSKALQRFVDKLPQSIYRAKGLFYLAESPEQRATLHLVGKRATLNVNAGNWQGQKPQSQFVVIGAADTLDTSALEAGLQACTLSASSDSRLERLTQSIVSWLRLG